MTPLAHDIALSVGILAVTKGMDYLFTLSPTRATRQSAHEVNVDAATRTALDALQQSLELLRRDLDTEVRRRSGAETTVEALKVAVDALAGRIEEQERMIQKQAVQIAEARGLRSENAKLKTQVAALKRQVSALSLRIEELEGTREAVTRILADHPDNDSDKSSDPDKSSDTEKENTP